MAKEELTVTQLAEKIFQESGGIENVASVTHCMTRVRMTVRDHNKVSKQGLQNIPGVLGVVDDEQLQVIIGPGKVNKVANAMAAQAGVDLGQEIPVAATSGKEAVNAKAAEMKANQVIIERYFEYFCPNDPSVCRCWSRCWYCFCYDELDHCRKNRWRHVELLCHDFKYLKKRDVFLFSDLHRCQCSSSI